MQKVSVSDPLVNVFIGEIKADSKSIDNNIMVVSWLTEVFKKMSFFHSLRLVYGDIYAEYCTWTLINTSNNNTTK